MGNMLAQKKTSIQQPLQAQTIPEEPDRSKQPDTRREASSLSRQIRGAFPIVAPIVAVESFVAPLDEKSQLIAEKLYAKGWNTKDVAQLLECDEAQLACFMSNAKF